MFIVVTHALIGLVSALVIHELGHVLAAIAARARDIRVSFVGMHVDASFPAERVRAQALYFAGGALANGALALVLVLAFDGLGIIALVNALAAAVTLYPRAGSDGGQLRALAGRSSRR